MLVKGAPEHWSWQMQNLVIIYIKFSIELKWRFSVCVCFSTSCCAVQSNLITSLSLNHTAHPDSRMVCIDPYLIGVGCDTEIDKQWQQDYLDMLVFMQVSLAVWNTNIYTYREKLQKTPKTTKSLSNATWYTISLFHSCFYEHRKYVLIILQTSFISFLLLWT